MADFSESEAGQITHGDATDVPTDNELPVWGGYEAGWTREMLENTRDDTKRYRIQKTICFSYAPVVK